MNFKNIISDLKKQYFSTEADASTDGAATGKEYTLVDGATKITISELKVGGTVTIDSKAAPEGELTLEDGTLIKVDAAGVISEITPKKDEPAAAKIDEPVTTESLQKMAAAFADSTLTPEQKLANIELCVKALMEYSFGWQLREAQSKAVTDAAILTYKENFSKQEKVIKEQELTIKKQAIGFSKLADLVGEVAGLPTDTHTEKKVKNLFSKNSPEDKEAKMKKLQESMKQFKEETK